MSGSFEGWSEEAFDVLLRLDGDPSVADRERWRRQRELLVRQPMVALLQDVADADPTYDDFTVFGFASTVSWWQHQYASVRIARKVELGLRFDLDGLRAQGWWRLAPPEQIDRYRAAVAADPSGAELDTLVADLRDRSLTVTGDVMRRMPRGYPADHHRADLLRHRSLVAKRPLGCDGWLQTPEAVDRVLAAFTELMPFMTWLATHVADDRPHST